MTKPPLHIVAIILMSCIALPSYASEPKPEMQTARFEIMFLESMPDHHLMAIEASEICLQKTQRPELRNRCQQIVTAQRRETRLMQSWLNTWYGKQKTTQLSKADREMVDMM